MGNLKIFLLGGFTITEEGRSAAKFRSAKARALLAYLAVQPDQDHLRTNLATLFWGNLAEKAARTNLRIELSSIKKRLSAHPALEISHTTVRFHGKYATVDVVEFSEAITSFLRLPLESQSKLSHRLDSAIDVYRGEFLAGVHANDAPEFENWRVMVQERLHQQMMLALGAQQRYRTEQGRWPELADSARRQLALVPWAESAHLNLMQALAAQDLAQAALEQYDECRRILQEELGAEPAPAIRELAARLRQPAVARQSGRHNLVRQFKALVGSEEEIGRVSALIQRRRLVTLVGMGGVGKSRLAQEVAQNLLHDFVDGVWFVPLANIEPGARAPDQIALAIAAAIGFHITAIESPIAELADLLVNMQTLLILDNWEHLLASADSVLFPLLHDTNVHILATSRTPLQIEGETTVPLSGLSRDRAALLFVERARRIVPTFATGDDTTQLTADIGDICEQVGGLPLGIELAASWVEHFSVAEIGQSLAEIEVEPKQADELVLRHHSLSSLLEHSWRLLDPELQQILIRFSVFRGGFDRMAAATVADSGLSDLSALIGHSLVQRIAAGRYDLHPLVLEFAANKQASNSETAIHQRHSHHYLMALINTERSQRAEKLLVEFENIRSAWQHAVSAGEGELMQRVASQFGEYIGQFGLLSDGYQLFADAIDHFDGESGRNELVAQLLEQQWIFARPIYGLTTASQLQHRLLELTENVELKVKTHLELANRHAEAAEWRQADDHFERAELLALESKDPRIYIQTAERRIHVNALQFRGDFEKYIARLQNLLIQLDGLEVEEDDLENLRAALLASLSISAIRYGDYALALHCDRQNLTWAEALSHQHRKSEILLGVALAEQFSGMYDEAIAHNLEGLVLASATGADDDMGLLKANLCLTMRQSGEYEQGLRYGLEAVETLRALGLVRMEGQARNRVGHTLSALGRWADAYVAYGDALEVWAPQQHSNRYEAVAGRAVAACQLGMRDEAQALIEETLDYVANHGLQGLVEPVLLLLNCERLLTEVGQNDRSRQVLCQAEEWVETIAGRISDEVVRESFLHNRPDNQLLRTRLALLIQ